MSSNGQAAGNCFSERNISYDHDGNILHLDRYQDVSATPSTTLNFTYNGNRRSGYGYDYNGNITYDPTRNFEIRYNLLNLPSEVTDLSETVYYADGTRAGVMDPESGYWISRYIGSLIYSGEYGEESLDGIQTADGFIEWNGSAANATSTSAPAPTTPSPVRSCKLIPSAKSTTPSLPTHTVLGIR